MKRNRIKRACALGVFLLCATVVLCGISGAFVPVIYASGNEAAETVENMAGAAEETEEKETEEQTPQRQTGDVKEETEKEEPEKKEAESTAEEKKKVRELDLGDYREEMVPGEKQLITVTPIPLDAEYDEIQYYSSKPAVAVINGMGRITALKTGSTTIKISCGGVTESFKLTVKEEETTADAADQIIDYGGGDYGGASVGVKDIEISDHEDELAVNATITLTATVLPQDAADSVVSFKSSDPSVATVNSSGEVKGKSKGKVTITASAGGVVKKIPLTVYVKTTGIDLNRDYIVLKPGESFHLDAKAVPEETDQTIKFESADSTIAEVSGDGTVTAGKTGNTAIIVSNKYMKSSVSVIVGHDSGQRIMRDELSGAESSGSGGGEKYL